MESEPPPFRTLLFARSPHVQTIAATFGFARPPPSVSDIVELADGDRIALEISTPPVWREDGLTVLAIHGLCGCSGSPYMVRLAVKLWNAGVRCVRMNLRGCGPGFGLARRIYHSGRSEDALAAVQALRKKWPESGVALVGFSLGGNIALKLAGELGEQGSTTLRQVAAVSPPVDLRASAQKLSGRGGQIYERMFVQLLRKNVAERHAHFSDMSKPRLPRKLRLIEFDNLYTAPECGFRDALDYYERASSGPLLRQIGVPTRILFARDDPLIDTDAFDRFELSPSVMIHRTERGGHLGFLGRPGQAGGYRWMDAAILRWLGVIQLESCPIP